jgi:hypothetical protein
MQVHRETEPKTALMWNSNGIQGARTCRICGGINVSQDQSSSIPFCICNVCGSDAGGNVLQSFPEAPKRNAHAVHPHICLSIVQAADFFADEVAVECLCREMGWRLFQTATPAKKRKPLVHDIRSPTGVRSPRISITSMTSDRSFASYGSERSGTSIDEASSSHLNYQVCFNAILEQTLRGFCKVNPYIF